MTETPQDQLRLAMLVLRCQLGDKSAFVQLWRRYHQPLARFVRRIVLPAAEPDDVLQDIWLTAWGKIASLASPEAFPAWLFSLARNKSYQAVRKALRRLPHPSALPRPSSDPGDELGLTEQTARVQAALDAMDPEHRQVLVLRFFRNMPYRRIAQTVGCNAGTVKSRLHYAKRTLKAIMERTNHERFHPHPPDARG